MEPHLEKNLIINNRELKYKGIFRVDELFSTINQALLEKGYQLREKKSEETVSEAGRKTSIELRPFKIKAEYAQLMIKIKIHLDSVTETKEEIHGEKKLFQQGDVLIAFDGWVLTDYQQRWGMKPWVFFMKGMIHKFLYKFPLEAGFPRELGGDTAHVYAKIKSLLNSYKMEAGKFTPEEEIKKQVEEEIRKEIEEGESREN
jgi:hypothetical protein